MVDVTVSTSARARVPVLALEFEIVATSRN